ncbi:hypothetical protein NVP1152O_089 [Vibrio phage 1.152.O._10N.222.46.E1]|uniref:Uncharacterized protein n=4 Tax=Nahantvirus 49C7 TaxID=2846601 RepID=A0A2I7RBJ8_9CAUD|nr:hypothetical protein NVP1025O_088 [Vibrio phage 1.025.O._10N.222.46.B6]AUR90821.1 hypothetical protein NVP1150O_088 [Vibrio phage 1.150.O._10N.222.46.A6]AUR90994.1 hypothetical protein NVP1152O_089 [Vibrio phage 1.152.O._10N.222.46.E1]AUS02462.1 hypothetical protein NVP2130O_088 [Vibrio phage 2.130.O._10N.222.46.C2]
MISVYINGIGSMFLLVHNNKAWWYCINNAEKNYVPNPKAWWSRDVEYTIGICTHLFDVNNVSDVIPVYKMEILMND